MRRKSENESSHGDPLNGASERLLTKDETASFYRVTKRTIELWMKEGKVPYFAIGRTVRFRLADLIEHLEMNQKK